VVRALLRVGGPMLGFDDILCEWLGLTKEKVARATKAQRALTRQAGAGAGAGAAAFAGAGAAGAGLPVDHDPDSHDGAASDVEAGEDDADAVAAEWADRDEEAAAQNYVLLEARADAGSAPASGPAQRQASEQTSGRTHKGVNLNDNVVSARGLALPPLSEADAALVGDPWDLVHDSRWGLHNAWRRIVYEAAKDEYVLAAHEYSKACDEVGAATVPALALASTHAAQCCPRTALLVVWCAWPVSLVPVSRGARPARCCGPHRRSLLSVSTPPPRLLFRARFPSFSQLEEHYRTDDVRVLRGVDVIGMTITCATRMLDVLRGVRCPVVVVEEAAEVLEPHLVATLTNDTQALLLIGDDKQLRPKVNMFNLERNMVRGVWRLWPCLLPRPPSRVSCARASPLPFPSTLVSPVSLLSWRRVGCNHVAPTHPSALPPFPSRTLAFLSLSAWRCVACPPYSCTRSAACGRKSRSTPRSCTRRKSGTTSAPRCTRRCGAQGNQVWGECTGACPAVCLAAPQTTARAGSNLALLPPPISPPYCALNRLPSSSHP
jgi:hypothetical protein